MMVDYPKDPQLGFLLDAMPAAAGVAFANWLGRQLCGSRSQGFYLEPVLRRYRPSPGLTWLKNDIYIAGAATNRMTVLPGDVLSIPVEFFVTAPRPDVCVRAGVSLSDPAGLVAKSQMSSTDSKQLEEQARLTSIKKIDRRRM
jgi:hypothetical protein